MVIEVEIHVHEDCRDAAILGDETVDIDIVAVEKLAEAVDLRPGTRRPFEERDHLHTLLAADYGIRVGHASDTFLHEAFQALNPPGQFGDTGKDHGRKHTGSFGCYDRNDYTTTKAKPFPSLVPKIPGGVTLRNV
jgi:hypothetical protein